MAAPMADRPPLAARSRTLPRMFDDDTSAQPTVQGTVPAYFVAMGGRDVRIVLAGASVITGEGEDSVVQQFDDPYAARAHLELVLKRHRRQGYAITERALSGAELAGVLGPDGAPDTLASLVTWDPEHSRMTVKFRERGDALRCGEIVARAAELAAEWIQVICDPASPGNALATSVARRPLPVVRSVAFDTHFQTVTRQRKNDPGELTALLAGLPGLERLFATGYLRLRPTTHAHLSELYLLGDPLQPELLTGLGGCRFPELAVLALKLASDAEPPDSRAVASALRSLQAPALAHLELADVDDIRDFLDVLTASPLPESWQTLRVSGSVADEDELLELLTSRAKLLGSLEQLALPLDELSTDGAEQARRLVPELVELDELPELLTPASYRQE